MGKKEREKGKRWRQEGREPGTYVRREGIKAGDGLGS